MTDEFYEPLEEGHLPAEQSVEFFLGLACNTALRAGVRERDLESALGMMRGSFKRIENGGKALAQTEAYLLWIYYRHPEDLKKRMR